jgi:TldD protein
VKLTRREFIRTAGLASGAVVADRMLGGPGIWSIQRLEAAPLTQAELKSLADVALARAKSLGCSYADIRINRYRNQVVGLSTRPDRAAMGSGKVNNVPTVIESESFGFGVRVLHSGTWGFAASPKVTKEEVARITAEAVGVAKANATLQKRPVQLAPVPAYQDTWKTPLEKDPFAVPIQDKLALLQAVHDKARTTKGVMGVQSGMVFRSEDKYFASSEGSNISQLIVQVAPTFAATAVDFMTRKTKSRSYQIAPKTAGYEHIETCGLLENAERVGAEAVEHLSAPSVEPGVKDVILMPSHLALVIHESIGHSTELDRALGYEANFAGTSFVAPPEKVLGKLEIGSKLMNIVGDRTLPQAMATVGYDDDGVKSTSFDIIKDGVFVGYQTIRDQAHLVGEKASRGCCNADSFDSIPFQRIPNVWLKPGPNGTSVDDLIAQVQDGILIDGRGSWSIDHQRYNFQFGGDGFWEIKNGKKGRMLADVAYQSKTTDFWHSLAGIADQSHWENFGLTNDGKGQPQQVNAMSHGCAPSLFRGVNVLRTE